MQSVMSSITHPDALVLQATKETLMSIALKLMLSQKLQLQKSLQKPRKILAQHVVQIQYALTISVLAMLDTLVTPESAAGLNVL